ncbi:gliding motility-associated C-terminal domain-containing protein [Terrimonas sp. NA20]|uniref:Gliding motility-associated C-terminal domain-containing protein n=1 Tax=Terrimonas ginsenosidimutans TaxID=2908004 RepID=A0ABS9KXM3_9BACT|nr:gliding motility-associated C-terminal domain-containing protein [Terrimonas ginsenosidimutans]MCG2617122.1 gliding motility-associated C-terminal domain-containing protein [Terrimonas ginsenosidimutans]
MKHYCIIVLLFTLFLPLTARLQVCTTLGQTPETAFPVCGSSVFTQTNVPICRGGTVPAPCADGGYQDVNPFFYRFKCFAAGTLGFTITPLQTTDDYDWQLFDITGVPNVRDIYSNIALFVACNWSGRSGITGTSNNNNGLIQCGGNTFPNFSSMPGLIAGHEYILLVSNFSASQRGYNLAFSGGTAVITDPSLPAPAGAVINCDANEVSFRFNKKMRCHSVAANGTDFRISGGVAITAAEGFKCSASFDFDSVRLTLASPLPPGNYTVTVATGSDGNTILDICNTSVLVGATATFTVPPKIPLPMGTVVPPACTPSVLVFDLPEPVRCNSIAANGTDFIVSGPGAVTISGATATCNSAGYTNQVSIEFTSPVVLPGNYQLIIQQGTDGNTLTGECNRMIAAGQAAGFNIAPQPPIAMGTVVPPSCAPQTITFNLPEKIFCSTIAAQGSDFRITGPAAVTITGATATCDANGQATAISIQLSAPLAVTGNYQLRVVSGSDGNTLIGDCSRILPAGLTTGFFIPDAPFTAMGSFRTPGCAPNTLQLELPATVQCSSIASDGSDFRLSGPSPVTVTGATGNCTNGLSQSITLQLSAAITLGGNYTIELVRGSDGNTLLSECYRETPAGGITGFATSDTVSAVFSIDVDYDCLQNQLRLGHDGAHGVNSWNWTLNGTGFSTLQNVTRTLSSLSQNQVTLTVSNGVCTDTHTEQINFSNKLVAAFDLPDMACPGDKIEIVNKSSGPVTNWNWTFGSTIAASSLQTPPAITYPLTGTDAFYPVRLTVSDNNGCEISRTEQIRILGSCVIGVPSAFTPNNDGKNDYFFPLNAFKADQLNFRVFNRWGQLVFHTTDWTRKWDGSVQGIPQATGTFVWMLDYVHKDTKEKVSQRGTVTLIR